MTQEALKLALEALEVATTPLAKDRQEVLRAITAIKEALAQTQEPVEFAGIKMWVGNYQVVRLLTKTELHHAIDPWLLVELNAKMCIKKLKEKNT